MQAKDVLEKLKQGKEAVKKVFNSNNAPASERNGFRQDDEGFFEGAEFGAFTIEKKEPQVRDSNMNQTAAESQKERKDRRSVFPVFQLEYDDVKEVEMTSVSVSVLKNEPDKIQKGLGLEGQEPYIQLLYKDKQQAYLATEELYELDIKGERSGKQKFIDILINPGFHTIRITAYQYQTLKNLSQQHSVETLPVRNVRGG